ncbi:hypothetical protein V8D89_003227 [Ganoderma adspersum]
MFLWPWSTARRKTYESLSQSPALSPTSSKALRESVNTLIDSLPGLLKALDEVAQLHPFTGITVDAFRVAVELHVKRGGNDEKIGVLFVEMRDTMEAMLQCDIREIWREMQWPGHVEARQFLDMQREGPCGDAAVNWIVDQDEWALEWINTIRLQAIMEAFDDDGSRLITVAEVNHFTESRPKDWSLSHWLAYWAIGWQMTATKYRDMIIDIFAKMFAIRSRIHPANRNVVDKYLQTVWQKITTLTASFVNANQPDSLYERFKSYVEAEEQRLRQGLETVGYDIEAMDTLLLVTGPGRIEKVVLSSIASLSCGFFSVTRDFEIFRLCPHTVIHKDELWDSADTILWVIDAVAKRHNNLEALFELQNLDPGPQFRTFACELFDFWHEFERFWLLENQLERERVFAEVEYDDAKEDQDVDASKFLNYAPAAEDLYPQFVEDSITEFDTAAEEAVRLMYVRSQRKGISSFCLG